MPAGRFGFALVALIALGGLAAAQVGVKPPAGGSPLKPPGPAASILVPPTPTRTPTPTQTSTPGPLAPVHIKTGKLIFVALPVTPTPTFAPVRIATGKLAFNALPVTPVPPTPTFAPVRIRTDKLQFEAR